MSRKTRPPKPKKSRLVRMGNDVLLLSEWTTFAFTPMDEDRKGELDMMLTLKGRFNNSDEETFLKVAMSVDDAAQFMISFGSAVRKAIEEKKAGIEDELAFLENQYDKMQRELGFAADSPELSILVELIDGAHKRKDAESQTI